MQENEVLYVLSVYCNIITRMIFCDIYYLLFYFVYFILPDLLHGCENGHPKTQPKRLDAFDIWCLWKISSRTQGSGTIGVGDGGHVPPP